MKQFQDSTALLNDGPALAARLNEDGYLFLRGLFPREDIMAVRRRLLGRPGLYMQSRFPRKDAENGKTSAPYAVFQGFSDVFPDFETWLGGIVDADRYRSDPNRANPWPRAEIRRGRRKAAW